MVPCKKTTTLKTQPLLGQCRVTTRKNISNSMLGSMVRWTSQRHCLACSVFGLTWFQVIETGEFHHSSRRLELEVQVSYVFSSSGSHRHTGRHAGCTVTCLGRQRNPKNWFSFESCYWQSLVGEPAGPGVMGGGLRSTFSACRLTFSLIVVHLRTEYYCTSCWRITLAIQRWKRKSDFCFSTVWVKIRLSIVGMVTRQLTPLPPTPSSLPTPFLFNTSIGVSATSAVKTAVQS